jgi:O-antigen/teichoic acid export membrane protein
MTIRWKWAHRPLLTRFSQSVGANAFGQVVTSATQLIQVPLFLHYWGKSYYGEWLVLGSFPALMSLADAGLGTVAANEAAMLSGAHKFAEAQQQITVSWSMQVRLLGAMAVLIPLIFWVFSPAYWLNLGIISKPDAWISATLMGWGVLLAIPWSLLLGMYRAEGRNARGTMVLNFIRIVGLLATVGALWCGARVVGLAAVGCLTQSACFTWLIWDSQRHSRLRLRIGQFQWREFKRQLAPAFGFQLFPIGNALYFQGQTLLVNYSLGAQQVVVFNTLRTLTRVVAQIAGMIKHSAWPEFSLLRNHPDPSRLRRFATLTAGLCGGVAGAAALAIVLFGPLILTYWTHGQVEAGRSLIAFFVLPAILNALWAVPAGLLQSTNSHMPLAWAYLGSCLLGFSASWALSCLGLAGMIFGMISSEFAMLIGAAWLARELLKRLEEERKGQSHLITVRNVGAS